MLLGLKDELLKLLFVTVVALDGTENISFRCSLLDTSLSNSIKNSGWFSDRSDEVLEVHEKGLLLEFGGRGSNGGGAGSGRTSGTDFFNWEATQDGLHGIFSKSPYK